VRRALALVAALAALTSATARADGDPASDVLYFQDVFLPYAKPSPDVAGQLTSAVTSSGKAGVRVKVAVIASEQDLGSVPSLFGKPGLYARFLGTELQSFYTQRLLVVMPAGFGLFFAGKPTTRETAALSSVSIASPAPDDLTKAATAAVHALSKAVAPTRGKDRTAPTVAALPSKGAKGKTAALRYRVFDAGGKSREIVRVYGPGLLLFATISTRPTKAKPKRTTTVTWKVPADLSETSIRFCVLAQDAAGNQSKTSCAPLTIS
jgi:hypothetical protein